MIWNWLDIIGSSFLRKITLYEATYLARTSAFNKINNINKDGACTTTEIEGT